MKSSEFFSRSCLRHSCSILLILVLTVLGLVALITVASGSLYSEKVSRFAMSTDDVHPAGLKYESTTKRKEENNGKLRTNLNAESKIHTNINVSNIFKNRLQRLQNGCKQIRNDVIRRHEPKLYFSEERKAVACKTQKTGSSFLAAIFLALNTEKDVNSIFSINRNGIHYAVGTMGVDGFKTKGLNDKNTLNILVARDPFQRLFSVFIDKVFLLGSIGRGVERFRGNKYTKNASSICGYNVTFQDFLDNILPSALAGSTVNRHWAPVSKLCDPCLLKYDLICKTETLTRDIEFVLDNLDLSEAKRQSIKSMFYSKGLRNTVYSLVAAYMSDYRVYQTDCPNVMLLMEKIWKVFQIQGYLHDSVPFPRQTFSNLKEKEPQGITDLIVKGIEFHPVSKTERDTQRRKWIAEGYRGIRQETIESIRRVYRQDFMLFGYDLNPPSS